ncbi:hypothetical protein GCM10020216_035880 [Nonomuraea helvata]
MYEADGVALLATFVSARALWMGRRRVAISRRGRTARRFIRVPRFVVALTLRARFFGKRFPFRREPRLLDRTGSRPRQTWGGAAGGDLRIRVETFTLRHGRGLGRVRRRPILT